jgi:hypothetical protein
MVRGLLITLALAVGVTGCGREAEIAELKQYVKSIQEFHSFNERVERTILRFDDPSVPVTDADIEAARAMLDEYAAAVDAIPELDERTIRNTHDLYQRSFEDARRLARDETGDTRRQAHSVAIGLRNLRRDIEQRVYPSLIVLLAREQLEGGEYELAWPEL